MGEGPAAITAAAAFDQRTDWVVGWLTDWGVGDMSREDDFSWNSRTISQLKKSSYTFRP